MPSQAFLKVGPRDHVAEVELAVGKEWGHFVDTQHGAPHVHLRHLAGVGLRDGKAASSPVLLLAEDQGAVRCAGIERTT